MESRQQKSDRQMHSLLLQTKRLKQENEELQAQMSASGPSQSRHPQSQQIAQDRLMRHLSPGTRSSPLATT